VLAPATNFSDALDFLRWAWNCAELPMELRVRAAVAALPYVHARIGKAGKRAAAELQAKTAHEGTEWDGLLQQ
jgi:hypothetical protein